MSTTASAKKLCKVVMNSRVASFRTNSSQTILCPLSTTSTNSIASSSSSSTQSWSLPLSHKRSFSSMLVDWDHYDEDVDIDENNHRDSGSFSGKENITITNTSSARYPCGNDQHEDELDDLPPPLPEPSYTVHKRVLPSTLTAFSSTEGKELLMGAFVDGTAESYWNLTEHFVNQSDPAFCGVSTLLMVLNAMCIDPNIRWRGGWRFYGSEDVLLDRCCFSAERIRRRGIIMEDFCRLGRCHGLTIDLKRPTLALSSNIDNSKNSNSKNINSSNNTNDVYFNNIVDDDNDENSSSLDDFRNDIRSILSDTISKHKPILVVSFSRSALNQTGGGHFSPIGAYHEESDTVLVLDVARFKYAPYWVRVTDLFRSMQEIDNVTKKARGWFLLSPPKNHECMHDDYLKENRRMVEFVPQLGDGTDSCPVSAIKIHFCRGNRKRRSSMNH